MRSITKNTYSNNKQMKNVYLADINGEKYVEINKGQKMMKVYNVEKTLIVLSKTRSKKNKKD